MANYFPLVLDKNTPKLQELSAGDTLDLTGSLLQLQTGTISSTPTSSTDIANKAYVDAVANGLNFHAAVDYATTAALGSYTYSNGTNGVGATLTGANGAALTIDGHLLTSTDVTNGTRILVKNETGTYTNDTTMSAAFNGVYKVTAVSTSPSTAWVLTRTTDFDTAGTGVNEIDAGDFMYILSGTANANSSWIQQNKNITVGTSSLTFIQFSASGGGTSLTISGISQDVVPWSAAEEVAPTGLGLDYDWNGYYFNVIAFDSQGNTTAVDPDWSNNNFINLSDYGHQIVVSWPAVTNASYYRVYWTNSDSIVRYYQTTSSTFTLNNSVVGVVGNPPTTQVNTTGLKVHGPSIFNTGLDVKHDLNLTAGNFIVTPSAEYVVNGYKYGRISINNNTNNYGNWFHIDIPAGTVVPKLRGTYYDANDDYVYECQFSTVGLDINGSQLRSSTATPTLFGLPTSTGSTNWVLTTDGSGWTTWRAASGAGQSFIRKNTATTLSNNTSVQGIFYSSQTGGIVPTLNYTNNTPNDYIFEIDCQFRITTTGTVSHTESFGIQISKLGNPVTTVTWNGVLNVVREDIKNDGTSVRRVVQMTTTNSVVIVPATTSAQDALYTVRGYIISSNVNTNTDALRMSPVITFSAAPGGTSTIGAGAYFRCTPIGAVGDITIGTVYST